MGSGESKHPLIFGEFMNFYTYHETIIDNRFGECKIFSKNDDPKTFVFAKHYALITDEEKDRFQLLLTQRNYQRHTHFFQPVYSISICIDNIIVREKKGCAGFGWEATLVWPYVEKTMQDLVSEHQHTPNKTIEEKEAWVFLRNLVQTIKSLRESGHAHGDIQPKFFSPYQDTQKLYDPCFINAENGGAKRMVRDRRYTSPISPEAIEFIKGERKAFDAYKNDVWAIGN